MSDHRRSPPPGPTRLHGEDIPFVDVAEVGGTLQVGAHDVQLAIHLHIMAGIYRSQRQRHRCSRWSCTPNVTDFEPSGTFIVDRHEPAAVEMNKQGNAVMVGVKQVPRHINAHAAERDGAPAPGELI